MKRIKESDNKLKWPRKEYKTIECRKRDLIIRIADWTRDKEEPGYDVEVYIGGIYDFNESKVCSFREYGTKARSRAFAIEYAQKQIAKLL